jgi:hypothetical protein
MCTIVPTEYCVLILLDESALNKITPLSGDTDRVAPLQFTIIICDAVAIGLVEYKGITTEALAE